MLSNDKETGATENGTRPRVYVSGKYEHADKIGLYIHFLRSFEHYQVTWDWTLPEARALGAREAGIKDTDGVRECDALLVILDCPVHPYRGTFCELGIALGLQKPVIVFYDPKSGVTPESFSWFPFLQHPLCFHIDNWELALAQLRLQTQVVTMLQ